MFQNNVDKLKQWASERGLLEADPDVQFAKIYEEFGEVSSALLKNKTNELVDSIGDLQVTIIIYAHQKNIDIVNSVATAELIHAHELSTPYQALQKIGEKLGNASESSFKGNSASLSLSLGAAILKIRMFAELLGYDATECLSEAYDVIKNRTGSLVGGTFIKTQDQQ